MQHVYCLQMVTIIMWPPGRYVTKSLAARKTKLTTAFTFKGQSFYHLQGGSLEGILAINYPHWITL